MMSRHWKISTDRHFQNDHHNIAQIQHCPISTTFHMWVNPHIKFWWYRTMLNFYRPFFMPFWTFWKHRIAPLMVTYHHVKFYVSIHLEVININVRNFNFSDFNDISYVGKLWCPEFIPNFEKFLVVAIFKMATKIKHCPISSKFDMWVHKDEIFQCRE
jgi:hypothetical protein